MHPPGHPRHPPWHLAGPPPGDPRGHQPHPPGAPPITRYHTLLRPPPLRRANRRPRWRLPRHPRERPRERPPADPRSHRSMMRSRIGETIYLHRVRPRISPHAARQPPPRFGHPRRLAQISSQTHPRLLRPRLWLCHPPPGRAQGGQPRGQPRGQPLGPRIHQLGCQQMCRRTSQRTHQQVCQQVCQRAHQPPRLAGRRQKCRPHRPVHQQNRVAN